MTSSSPWKRLFFAVATILALGVPSARAQDPGATSSVILVNGIINGQSVSPTNRTVVVSPGEIISGSFNVVIESRWPFSAVMAMGVTPTWGSPDTSYVALPPPPSTVFGLNRNIPTNFVAPNVPGTYFIIVAFRAEFTAGQVMSSTNWTVGSLVWTDNNDVAEWTPTMIQAAIQTGRVTGSILGAAGYFPAVVPATAIQVEVIGPPAQPTGLGVAVGEGSAYLRWGALATPVDKYLIQIEREGVGSGGVPDGVFLPLGIVEWIPQPNSNPGIVQSPTILLTNEPGGSRLQDYLKYRFTVLAERNGIQGPVSSPVVAIPSGFSGTNLPPKLSKPLLLLSGWLGDGRKTGTWNQTIDFLERSLDWDYGGQLYHLEDSFETLVDQSGQCDPEAATRPPHADPPPVPCANHGKVLTPAQFYSASFGNNVANYADNLGLAHQATEVRLMVDKLFQDGVTTKVALVAHSNGGLAARDYLTRASNATSRISHLVTYGTPHRGLNVLPLHFSGSTRDSAVTCAGQALQYSNYLDDLNRNPARLLPDTVDYTTIVGNFPFTRRLADCHSSTWDGLVPTSSADLRKAGNLPAGKQIRALPTNHFHMGQGDDFPTILCAISPACLHVQVMSPVDVEVTAPDGRQMARDYAAIPGASYMNIEEDSGHETATVLIPFPLPGDYNIKAVPKPGTAPTDTFTIIVTQHGIETVVAQDMTVQDAPADGFTVRANTPPVANAGADQTVECASHMGTPIVLDGTLSTDADGDPLTYEWRDSGGNLVASSGQILVSLSLGSHTFTLTVTDSKEVSSSDGVTVTIQDTTAPVLTLAQNNITVVLPTPSATGVAVDLNGIASATDVCDPDMTITHDAPALFPIGATVVTFTATDDSGNTSQKQLTVRVVYGFGGILPPINGDGSSIFRSGRTIPVKFQLTAADGSYITNAVATLQVFKITNQVTGAVEEITTDAAGQSNADNLFRYDPTSSQYIYNLKTTGYSAGTYLLRVHLSDGTSHGVYVSVR